MGKGLFRRKVDTLLGIDINDTAIRLVELGRSPAGYSVQGYVTQGLPAQAVGGPTLTNSWSRSRLSSGPAMTRG